MSRTYRKKPYRWKQNEVLVDWHCHEDDVIWEDVEYVKHNHDYGGWFFTYYTVKYRADSPTGKKMLAKGRRDETNHCKEPGPAFWRRMTSEAKMKTWNKRELKKFMSDPEYDPLVYAMFPLDYWT